MRLPEQRVAEGGTPAHRRLQGSGFDAQPRYSDLHDKFVRRIACAKNRSSVAHTLEAEATEFDPAALIRDRDIL
jgi:hypothetical protein